MIPPACRYQLRRRSQAIRSMSPRQTLAARQSVVGTSQGISEFTPSFPVCHEHENVLRAAVVLLVMPPEQVLACTWVGFLNDQKHCFVGRAMEWPGDLNATLTRVPRGHDFGSFQATHGFVGISHNGIFSDGMNEHGLALRTSTTRQRDVFPVWPRSTPRRPQSPTTLPPSIEPGLWSIPSTFRKAFSTGAG